MRRAIMEMEDPKIKRIIIAVKIFGAAEGFLPNAVMLAIPPAAMMAEGPRIATENIKKRADSRFKVTPQ